jgi:hypothetical protein
VPTLGTAAADPDGDGDGGMGRMRFRDYMQAAGGQMQTNLSSLLQQLSQSTSTTGTDATSTTTTSSSNSNLSSLQTSFDSLVQSLGGQGNNAMLSSFLQNLQNSLQQGNTTGNLVAVTA